MTPPRPHSLRQGLFIVFEGLDGAGKTTQVHLLCERLRHSGYGVVPLKEPTDGPWGRNIRHLARYGRQHVPLETELTWFLEDRRQDVEHNIKPALARGDIVVLDRYYFSTMAYQGARGGDPDTIRQRNEAFAPPPDLLFLLEITPQEGLQRIQQQRLPDEFERLEYLERVAALFAQMDFPYLQRLPATLAPEAMHNRIWQTVQTVLTQRQHDHQSESLKVQEICRSS
jgi:dTMP kinase